MPTNSPLSSASPTTDIELVASLPGFTNEYAEVNGFSALFEGRYWRAVDLAAKLAADLVAI